MTSSNENIFRVTGHLRGEFTADRWIPCTKASDAELRWFVLIRVWINGWVNNCEAGDLRRHRAHYDVIVMRYMWSCPLYVCTCRRVSDTGVCVLKLHIPIRGAWLICRLNLLIRSTVFTCSYSVHIPLCDAHAVCVLNQTGFRSTPAIPIQIHPPTQIG